MKSTMQKVLQAKQAQRAKSAGKSIAEKLALVERMRERNAPLKALRDAAQAKKGPVSGAR